MDDRKRHATDGRTQAGQLRVIPKLRLVALALATTISGPLLAQPRGTTTEAPGLSGAPRGSAESGGSAFISRPRISPADMKAALEADGYSNVEILKETNDGYDAKATKDGREVDLKLDVRGTVVPATR
jgi:hypothetical protein